MQFINNFFLIKSKYCLRLVGITLNQNQNKQLYKTAYIDSWQYIWL